MRIWMRLIAGAFAVMALDLVLPSTVWAIECPVLTDTEKGELLALHLFGGPPSGGEILIRRGYVTEYDSERRVPRWTAWSAAPEYLDTPKRKGRWSSFRGDPDIDNPVVKDDYTGLHAEFDYARGHIVPYFVSGGDRDNDGIDAEVEGVSNLPIEDIDDACTVFEINYMSNIAPQFHSTFNGSGGLWFELETIVRQKIVGDGATINIIAGTVFGEGQVHKVGPDSDIHVPHMFYKILVTEFGLVPFLFVHTAQVGPAGCDLDAALETCIVKLADIEAITGLDFLAGLSDEDEALWEGTDGKSIWQMLIQ